MYPEETSFTYGFKAEDYSSALIDWVEHVPSDNTFLLTPSQAEFDLFCGTTIDTY